MPAVAVSKSSQNVALAHTAESSPAGPAPALLPALPVIVPPLAPAVAPTAPAPPELLLPAEPVGAGSFVAESEQPAAASSRHEHTDHNVLLPVARQR
jgi:hypothetical protein